MDGQYWKGDRTMSTNEWLLTSDFWQFLEPWHGRWYEYEIFIASCTDNINDLENERWLLGDMIDHVGIYGSRVAEGLSAFNDGLVITFYSTKHNLSTLPTQGCVVFLAQNTTILHRSKHTVDLIFTYIFGANDGWIFLNLCRDSNLCFLLSFLLGYMAILWI